MERVYSQGFKEFLYQGDPQTNPYRQSKKWKGFALRGTPTLVALVGQWAHTAAATRGPAPRTAHPGGLPTYGSRRGAELASEEGMGHGCAWPQAQLPLNMESRDGRLFCSKQNVVS